MFHYTANVWRRLRACWQRWQNDLPRERRQGPRCRSTAQLGWRPAESMTPDFFHAGVHDVSFAGIALRVDRPVVQGMLLHLQLPAAAPAADCLLACVARAEPRAGGGWFLGCSLIRDLTEAELQRFL
jgi:hypothetical protein